MLQQIRCKADDIDDAQLVHGVLERRSAVPEVVSGEPQSEQKQPPSLIAEAVPSMLIGQSPMSIYDSYMDHAAFQERRQFELLSREELSALQLSRLNEMLRQILPANRFYAEKFKNTSLPLNSIGDLASLPFTTKAELQAEGDFAANRTYDLDRYVRFHRTSGTHGRPMIVVDTPEDWQRWTQTWQYVLDAGNVTPQDRALMAFSFGPFIGFWSANDALIARGAMVIPAGGLSTLARVEQLQSSGATLVCATPSYALRMAEVAREHDVDLTKSSVSRIIVAGEPGGSIPSIRKRIENAWDARVIDHSGASEVGPWGYADRDDQGLHIVEPDFIPEFISIETGQPATEGELSELVLTTLNRYGLPVIRYRTGDLVTPSWNRTDNRFVFLEGGVLGRTDDMLVIRGVNVFPSAIEQILCDFPEVQEYRITASKNGEMDALHVDVEDTAESPDRIADALNVRLGLTVPVKAVPSGSLPRFEGKGKRFVDQR